MAKAPCVLEYKIRGDAWTVDEELCTGCKRCLRVGCIALSLRGRRRRRREGQGGHRRTLCTGCGVCAQMCRFEAIGPRDAVPAAA